MLTTQTIEGLYALKLPAMAEAVTEQAENPEYQALGFDDRLGMLVTRELTERENRRLERYKKQAKLRTDAVIEDVDFRARRGLDRHQLLSLAECAWVKHHQMVAIVGATGLGKTYLGCVLANAAIRKGYTALYLRAPRMLDELAVARVDGRFQRLSAAWARVEVLLIDDFLLRPLTPDQAADTLEVIEERAGIRATILTSQLPLAHWHEALGEPTIADALLDRVCHRLTRIELSGESLRRAEEPKRRTKSAGDEAVNP